MGHAVLREMGDVALQMARGVFVGATYPRHSLVAGHAVSREWCEALSYGPQR